MLRHFTMLLAVSALALTLLAGNAISADYGSMTTQELSKLRGTMYSASQEDRDGFRTEWNKRIDAMTAEEKEQYLGPGGGRGKGNRNQAGLGDGRGRGRGGGQGSGQGGGRK